MGSSDYIDLVIVLALQCGKVLCCAPGFSGLQAGDDVRCEAYSSGKVVAVITVGTKSEVYDFLLKAYGSKYPIPKITSKVVYEAFSYDEQEDDNG